MLNTAILMSPVTRVTALAATALLPVLLWGGPVNLNTADADTIARELNGVGAARAQAIVDYRKEYGAFESPEELLNVTGVGRFIIDSNKDNILLDLDR